MNPYQAYKQNSIATASPKAILVRLHDKALFELSLAKKAWQDSNLSEMRPHITRVQDIISYLHTSLDPMMQLSEKLGGLYRYYLFQLSKIFVQPTEDLFTEVQAFFTEWRETWWKAEQQSIE